MADEQNKHESQGNNERPELFNKELLELTEDEIETVMMGTFDENSPYFSESTKDALLKFAIGLQASIAATAQLSQISDFATGIAEKLTQLLDDEFHEKIRNAISTLVANSAILSAKSREMEELWPFLDEELKRPEYGGKDIHELLKEAEQDLDEDGQLKKDSLYEKAFAGAILRRDAAAKLQAKTNARELAKSQGAIMSLEGALSSFSWSQLEKAFTAFSLLQLSDAVDMQSIYDENGNLDIHTVSGDLQHLDDIDTAALGAVLRAVILSNGEYIDPTNTETKVKIYLPSICKELKIDVRGGYSANREPIKDSDYPKLYHDAFVKKIMPFDRVIGRLPNGSYYRVLTISSYDAESQTLVLDTPYMYKALEIALSERSKNDKLVFVNELFLPSVYSERNHAAVEIAEYLTTKLLQRGLVNPKKDKDGNRYIEYTIKYSTVISECAQIKDALAEIERSSKNVRQAKNAKLKQTFTAAFRIIREKTTAADRFHNLVIDATYPTTSTLNGLIKITFTGKS